jgi:hypothetical protein
MVVDAVVLVVKAKVVEFVTVEVLVVVVEVFVVLLSSTIASPFECWRTIITITCTIYIVICPGTAGRSNQKTIRAIE